QIQEVSEKGYRHLLGEFIELYPPSKIIPYLETNFEIDELIVDWFKLKVKYINRLGEQTFNEKMYNLFEYHRNYAVPLEEIENILNSNKFKLLELSIDRWKKIIVYKKEKRKIVSKFKNSKLR